MNVGSEPRRRALVTAALLTVLFTYTNFTVGAATRSRSSLAGRIEILGVKNVGVSAADDAKSILQITWAVEAQSGATVKSFEVVLEVSYADGSTQKVRATVAGTARHARFEVPTVQQVAGRPAAELKQFKASVTANTSETTTRIGSL